TLWLRLHQRSDVAAAHQCHAGAGLCEVHYCQPNEQRNRSDEFEVKQRLRAHAPHFFKIAAAGNSDDQRRENQWRDDRLDQVEKNVSEEVDVIAPLRTDVTEQSAQHQAKKDLSCQRRAIPGALRSSEFRVSCVYTGIQSQQCCSMEGPISEWRTRNSKLET